MIECGKPGEVYNIGGEECSEFDVLFELQNLLKVEEELILLKNNKLNKCVLDSSKISNLGWNYF